MKEAPYSTNRELLIPNKGFTHQRKAPKRYITCFWGGRQGKCLERFSKRVESGVQGDLGKGPGLGRLPKSPCMRLSVSKNAFRRKDRKVVGVTNFPESNIPKKESFCSEPKLIAKLHYASYVHYQHQKT